MCDNKVSDGKIRIVIVDDHNVVRSGLGAFLQVFDDLNWSEAADGWRLWKYMALHPRSADGPRDAC